jgi:hypothetical protein
MADFRYDSVATGNPPLSVENQRWKLKEGGLDPRWYGGRRMWQERGLKALTTARMSGNGEA